MLAQLGNVPPRTLQLAAWCALALLVLAVGLYALKPAWDNYRQSRDSLELLTGIADDGGEVNTSIQQVRQRLDELRATLRGDAEGVPGDEVEAFVIGRLQKVSWEAGVELLGVTPAQAATVLQFQEIAFDVQLRGSYRDLFQWMEGLGNSLGFVLVKRFDIRPEGRQEGTPSLRMDVTVVFYRPI